LLSTVKTVGEQQTIVDAIYHTLVEQGKQLSKRANLYAPLCLSGPVGGDLITISLRKLVAEN